ncbi:MAG: hypothetical protein ACJA13_000461, partial [Paraglaciecola sp.]
SHIYLYVEDSNLWVFVFWAKRAISKQAAVLNLPG